MIGRAHKFKAKIYNDSDEIATDTQLKIALPEGATLQKGKRCEVDAEGQFIICAMGDIPANKKRSKTLYLTLNQAGEIAVQAEALSTLNDSDASNNIATASLTLSNDADLSVKIQKKGSARVGKALGIKIVTKNKGSAPAEQVDTVFPIPENAEFISCLQQCL